ncbi:MAG: phenylalanine--tRNA ligase subunit alpha [Candidatus Micrarchaeota archaeon]|nr:phenylalanine--tRNA ligase subunit alpha [Candidatus Micrarchaeota archaeon]
MYVGEDKVIELIKSRNSIMSLEYIALETKLNIDSVRRIIESLKENGYVSVEQSQSGKENLFVTTKAHGYRSGGPEFLIFKKAMDAKLQGKKLSAGELSQDELSEIRWAKSKGFITIENGNIIPRDTEVAVEKKRTEFCNALATKISENPEDKLKDISLELKEEFITRKLFTQSITKDLLVHYTGKPYHVSEESFDVSVESSDAQVGKNHPVTKMTDRIKQIFAELGFEEMEGDIVESTFWNFDALFQPQDHPARELADTFYLNKKSELFDSKLVARVKKAHEEGWKYQWSEEEAKRTVLRTHTTALSARYVAALKNDKPKKYFTIGRVFRNEATDYKHLAEFHQVEGIISWKDASFRDLLGILKEFYRKLGFEKIRFRPSFFPYTEPSLEIEIFYEPKQEWMEIGGAGILRPEVSIPLANTYPVLAWGLSLERPLMMQLDIKDMRTIYKNDLEFLKNSRPTNSSEFGVHFSKSGKIGDVARSRTDLEFLKNSRDVTRHHKG